MPKIYTNVLIEAIKTNTVIDALLAFNFSLEMKRLNINRIHCHHGDHKFFIGYYCKKIINCKLTVTIHSHSLYVNPSWELFERALNFCDKIISISKFNKDYLVDNFNISKSKISVIRLSVNLPKKVEYNNVKNIKTNILVVGQWTERKDHKTLIKALSYINQKEFQLWVVGSESWDSNKSVDVPKYVRKFDLESRTTFFGSVSDEKLHELYKKCDIFCLPSKTASDGVKEGIPVVLMEAMSYGKIVLSTKHAGIPELVEESLVEENNPLELSQVLDKLITDKSNRKERGQKNRQIIRQKYSSKNIDILFEELIKR